MPRPDVSDKGEWAAWKALAIVYTAGQWQAYGGAYGPWYRRHSSGLVMLGGLIDPVVASPNTTVGTLPAEARPITGGGIEEYFPISGHNGTTYFATLAYLYPDGRLIVNYGAGAATGWMSLAGIAFTTS